MDFDLVILGCGSAGTEAAKEALKYTKKILCIDRAPEEIGGTCLNRGCVPTKFLREGALLSEKIEKSSFYGIDAKLSSLNLVDAINSSKRNVIEPVRSGLLKFLKSKGVKFTFTDRVRVLDRNLLEVGGKKVSFKFLLIATGSSPSSVPNVVPDGGFVLDTDSFWDLEILPERVLIVGGGVSGVEFAYILKRYGAKEVYIVELADRLLPTTDYPQDMVRRLERSLKSEGIRIHTSTVVEDIDPSTGRVRLTGGLLLEVNKVLLTVGRKPNTSNLGLENVGVELTPKGYIKVDKGYRTAVNNIFAAGDVLPTPALAHVAEWEAKLAVRNMFENLSEELDYDRIPSVVYSIYELGGFGKNEKLLKEEGVKFETKMLTFRSVAKALAEREEGLIKVHADAEGNILGAFVLSRKHTDALIHLLLEAKNLNLLRKTVFAHPTVE